MFHSKPPTSVATDNTFENSIVNGTAKQKYPEQLTPDFIVSDTEYDKIISAYSGKRERKTWRIMSQNTTQYGNKELWDQDISNQQQKT